MPTDGEGAKPDTGAKPATDAADNKPTDPAPKPESDEGRAGGEAALKADLARERRERQTLQRQLEELQGATQSDQEKAISQARREATAEADGRWANHIRNAEVRGALRGAGISNDRFLDLAIAAPEFRELKVDGSSGTVEGVADAVKAFQQAYPEAFPKPAEDTKPKPNTTGQWDGAEGGSGKPAPKDLQGSVEDAIKAQFANAKG